RDGRGVERLGRCRLAELAAARLCRRTARRRYAGGDRRHRSNKGMTGADRQEDVHQRRERPGRRLSPGPFSAQRLLRTAAGADYFVPYTPIHPVRQFGAMLFAGSGTKMWLFFGLAATECEEPAGTSGGVVLAGVLMVGTSCTNVMDCASMTPNTGPPGLFLAAR